MGKTKYRHTICVTITAEHTKLCKSLTDKGFTLYEVDWEGNHVAIKEFPNKPKGLLYKAIYNETTTSREPNRKVMNIIWSSTADYAADRKLL